MKYTYKDYETQFSDNTTVNTFHTIKRKLSELGLTTSELSQADTKDQKEHKRLVQYLITNCKCVFTYDMQSIYWSSNTGYILFCKDVNKIFSKNELTDFTK